MFPWEQVDDLWATKSEDVGLLGHVISFQDFQPMWSWSTNITGGQTDGRTTCNSQTAPCTVVHSAVKSIIIWSNFHSHSFTQRVCVCMCVCVRAHVWLNTEQLTLAGTGQYWRTWIIPLGTQVQLAARTSQLCTHWQQSNTHNNLNNLVNNNVIILYRDVKFVFFF